jgi:hypothetical protein
MASRAPCQISANSHDLMIRLSNCLRSGDIKSFDKTRIAEVLSANDDHFLSPADCLSLFDEYPESLTNQTERVYRQIRSATRCNCLNGIAERAPEFPLQHSHDLEAIRFPFPFNKGTFLRMPLSHTALARTDNPRLPVVSSQALPAFPPSRSP